MLSDIESRFSCLHTLQPPWTKHSQKSYSKYIEEEGSYQHSHRYKWFFLLVWCKSVFSRLLLQSVRLSRGKSKPELFLHFLRRNNNPLGLNTKNIKRQPNRWNHSHTGMESTDLVSLLRIYATAKKKRVFPTKTKTLNRARGHKSKRRERVLLWIQGPKSRSRNTCRVQMTYNYPNFGTSSRRNFTLTRSL